jgi:hypothetical protein
MKILNIHNIHNIQNIHYQVSKYQNINDKIQLNI